MLFICFRAYAHLDETPKKYVAVAFWGSICFVLLAEKLVTQEHFHFIVYYVSIIFLAAYAGLIYIYKGGRRALAGFLALALVSMEAAINTTVTSVTTTSRESYTADNEEARILKDSLEPASDFYRVEKKTRKTKNDGAWMNFPSVSLFSSTANADLSKIFKKLGCESSTNAYSITGSTPLVDSIFSVKYALYSDAVSNTELMMYLRESGGTYLYENLYTLPLGFVLPSDIEENWQYEMDNPAEVQNDLCLVTGADEVLVDTGGTVNKNTFTFTPDMTGEYYVFVLNKKVKNVKADLPSGSKSFGNVDRGYLLELGTLSPGYEVKLTADEAGEQLNAIAYRFSEDAMIQVYDRLNRMPMHLTSWKDTKLSGTVTADRAGMLFTSIPFDKGWTVKVDGQKVETRKAFGAFLAIDVGAGDHVIDFSYFPEGLKPGVLITGGSIVILIFLWFLRREMERRRDRARMLRIRRMQREAEEEEEHADEDEFEEIPELDEETEESSDEMEEPDSEIPDMPEPEKHINHEKQTTEEQT